MDKIIVLVLCSFISFGCASTQPAVRSPESLGAQMEAARKVVGALAPAEGAVEKYSPVTGKHYSGALEYEPGTGVKLIPVEE
jgi:hypothetical protein